MIGAMCHSQRNDKHPPRANTRIDSTTSSRPQRCSTSNRLLFYLIVLLLSVETVVRLLVPNDTDDNFGTITASNDGNEEKVGLLSFIYDGSYSIFRSRLPQQQQAPSQIKKLTIGSGNGSEPERFVFDMISIGTLLQPDLQKAQYETFGSHPSVRNFYRMNESNDTDSTCATELTMEDLWSIQQICTRTDVRPAYLTTLFQNEVIYHPKPSTGWLCAQKRPIDGLYLALQRFLNGRNGTTDVLPHYLFMIDDDTYVNMDYMTNILPYQYPYDERYLMTGCLLKSPKSITFLFPFGGYGSILSRKTIERLIQPIYCTTAGTRHSGSSSSSSADDLFNNKACWRLQQNLIGEQAFFRNGMSILELMYTYSSKLQYTKSNEWGSSNRSSDSSDGTSFCFHSDQALGYFFGFYHIGVPDHVWLKEAPMEIDDYHQQDHPVPYQKTNDTLRIRFSYREIKIHGKATCKSRVGRYNSKHGKCRIGIDPFCHYIDAIRMHELYYG